LRRQLGLNIERSVKPRPIDPVTRISLTALSRLFSWRDALAVVRPETLIRRLARENPLWGEERIANELLVKLGIRLSPRTVRKYLPPRPEPFLCQVVRCYRLLRLAAVCFARVPDQRLELPGAGTRG